MRERREGGWWPGACNQVPTAEFTHLRDNVSYEGGRAYARECCVNSRIIYRDTGELTDVRADWPQPNVIA